MCNPAPSFTDFGKPLFRPDAETAASVEVVIDRRGRRGAQPWPGPLPPGKAYNNRRSMFRSLLCRPD